MKQYIVRCMVLAEDPNTENKKIINHWELKYPEEKIMAESSENAMIKFLEKVLTDLKENTDIDE